MYTLITGATSGIGLELAKQFVKNGKDVLLVSRNSQRLSEVAEELEQIYPVRVHYLAVDLSEPDSAKKVLNWTREKGYEVETLVNNAGFGSHGEFHKSHLKTECEMLELNIMSLMKLTRYFLPAMVFRRQGGVLNVASAAGFAPGIRMANYYASKAYVQSFTQALAGELRGTPINIAALCPGPVDTGFQARARLKVGKRNLVWKQKKTAKQVAEYAYQEFEKGKVLIFPGELLKTAIFLSRKFPLSWVRWVMSYFQ